LLGQGFGRPFAGEAALLGLPPRRRALTREVLLFGGAGPLVLARTVIPPWALRGEHCALAKLGNRPLGEVLFAQPRLRRTRLEFARLGPGDWLSAVAREHALDAPLWGRRSVYELGAVSLLVCEFFLPAVLSLEEFDGYA
jgi:chorismate--pyruvate lyase